MRHQGSGDVEPQSRDVTRCVTLCYTVLHCVLRSGCNCVAVTWETDGRPPDPVSLRHYLVLEWHCTGKWKAEYYLKRIFLGFAKCTKLEEKHCLLPKFKPILPHLSQVSRFQRPRGHQTISHCIMSSCWRMRCFESCTVLSNASARQCHHPRAAPLGPRVAGPCFRCRE